MFRREGLAAGSQALKAMPLSVILIPVSVCVSVSVSLCLSLSVSLPLSSTPCLSYPP